VWWCFYFSRGQRSLIPRGLPWGQPPQPRPVLVYFRVSQLTPCLRVFGFWFDRGRIREGAQASLMMAT
jgi:hypothetical protein